MKDKKRNTFVLRIVIGFVIAAFVVLFFMNHTTSQVNDEVYRDIRIYEISGTAQVEREELGALKAYNGMKLQSEDVLTTEKDSYVYLKFDDDKYALLEPESKIRLIASGDKKNSKTSIYLEEGSIINRLDEDLSEESIYEINTPNSTMAVRGTNFRIKVVTSAGEIYTYIDVYEGTVSCRLVYPDGTIEKEEVFAISGNEVQVYGNDQNAEYITIDEKVDYEALPVESLEFLMKVIEHGVELSISEEELQVLLDEKREIADPTISEGQKEDNSKEQTQKADNTKNQTQNVEEKQAIQKAEKNVWNPIQESNRVGTQESTEHPQKGNPPSEEVIPPSDQASEETPPSEEETPSDQASEETPPSEEETPSDQAPEETPPSEEETPSDQAPEETPPSEEETPSDQAPEEIPPVSECEKSPDGQHSWSSDGYDPEPSCETGGTLWYSCTHCGERKSENVEALGHDYNDDGVCKRENCEQAGAGESTGAGDSTDAGESADAITN